MPLEAIVRETTKVIEKGARVLDAGARKAWSVLEAAAEKKPPSEYLSPKAIQSMQGKTQG